ncbi:T6SS effector BTH_I2691 family protein [Halomonas litopenaei]|uniref:T6SS effector BTH_I2691 family protein n=1 Tax=Halomonas litopenaei TaxID=2109328 RepID=UPI003FA04183
MRACRTGVVARCSRTEVGGGDPLCWEKLRRQGSSSVSRTPSGRAGRRPQGRRRQGRGRSMADVRMSEIPDWLEALDDNSPLPGTKQQGCPCCDRVGLPILPVRYAVSDRHVSDWSQDLPRSMAVHANRHFPAPRETRYVLRLMREGYLYLFDEKRQRWQAWRITHDSRFEEFDPCGRGPRETAYGDSHTDVPCNIPENNLSARLISLPKAQEAGIVHVGYSDHPFTQAMLGRLERNEDGLRGRLLIPFDVAAWLGTGEAAGAIPSSQLDTHVMEFNDACPEELLENDGFPLVGVCERLPSTVSQLRDQMNWMVQDAPQWIDRTPILAVADPIGMCISVNHFRNQAKARLDRYARRTDVVEKKVTSELIEGIREAVKSKAEHQAEQHIERARRAEVFGDQRLAQEFDALTDAPEKARRWALLIVALEKNQLETWLTRCVFGNGDADAHYRDLQAALDALDDMTR